MTVIAWDGEMLAADKRMQQYGGIARTVTKIMRAPDGCLLAVTGSVDVGLEMRHWLLAGAMPADFPPKAREDVATLIVINRKGEVWTYAAGPFPMRMESHQIAFGSGRDYAEASMHLGCSAAEAVKVACMFQTDCGGGIDALVLNDDTAGF